MTTAAKKMEVGEGWYNNDAINSEKIYEDGQKEVGDDYGGEEK